jgi:hypothetical protein
MIIKVSLKFNCKKDQGTANSVSRARLLKISSSAQKIDVDIPTRSGYGDIHRLLLIDAPIYRPTPEADR